MSENNTMSNKADERPWNRVESPTVTQDTHGGERYDHPAFATISASRVSGHASLFGSNIGHDGFVKITIHEGTMYRDGYSERIHGGGKSYAEVWLSEAQWVAFVSRMNAGSTPCTLRHYGSRDGMVFCPQIANPEKAAERMAGRVAELEERNLQAVDEQSAAIRELCEGLPKKKAEAILCAAGLMSQHLKANHQYAGKTLREFKERLVTESKIEIDAMVTEVVGRFGLESVQQLGAILSADPGKAVKLLGNDDDSPPESP